MQRASDLGALKMNQQIKLQAKDGSKGAQKCAYAPLALIRGSLMAGLIVHDVCSWWEHEGLQVRCWRCPWTKTSCYWKTWALESCTCKCKETEEAVSYRTDTKLIWLKGIPHSDRTILPFSTQTFAGPTAPALGIHSQHQHSDFLPCSWYWYLLTAKITFWKESSGMLYKIITPGSTLPCVSLHFKMKVRKIASCFFMWFETDLKTVTFRGYTSWSPTN